MELVGANLQLVHHTAFAHPDLSKQQTGGDSARPLILTGGRGDFKNNGRFMLRVPQQPDVCVPHSQRL